MTNGNKMAEWRLYIEDIKVWSWTQGRSFMTNLFNKSCLDIHRSKTSKMIKIDGWVCESFCTLGTHFGTSGNSKGKHNGKVLNINRTWFHSELTSLVKNEWQAGIVQQSKISKGGGMSGGGRNIPLCNVSGGGDFELTSQAPPNTIEHQLQHHQQ